MIKIWLAIALTVILASSAMADGPAIGSPAPPFTLFDTTGNSIRLSHYKGQYLILNFWAFWCDTWKQELPSLLELAKDQRSDRFALAAISVDGTRLPGFENETTGVKIPFPVLLDNSQIVTTSYSIHHVPTVIIVDKIGRVRLCVYGFPGNHVLLSALRRIQNTDSNTP